MNSDENLVQLDAEHPGFRDREYRRRRDHIARLAQEYREGDPIPRVPYTDEEHGVWRAVWQELGVAHERWACAAYHEAARLFPLDREQIPQLADLDARLRSVSGFRMAPVAGLVTAKLFLSTLARDTFLATQYIRHHSRPLYTPEPDCVHEIVGHAVTLAHPTFARLNRAFGSVAEHADDARMLELIRAYWFTVEFGLVREAGELRAYGAGLLSSAGELERFSSATLRPFDIDEIVRTDFDPTNYQEIFFVADSLDAVAAELLDWLSR